VVESIISKYGLSKEIIKSDLYTLKWKTASRGRDHAQLLRLQYLSAGIKANCYPL
jgi:hypothetical protein